MQSQDSKYVFSTKLEAHRSDVRSVIFLGPNTVVTASRDASLLLWERFKDTHRFEPMRELRTHSGQVSSLAFIGTKGSGKGTLLSSSFSGEIHLHDIEDLDKPPVIIKGHESNICNIITNENGEILSGSWDKTAKLWRDGNIVYTLNHEYAVWGLAFAPNNKILTSSNEKIMLWERTKKIREYVGHTDCVRSLAMIDDKNFISCSNDATIRIWQLEDGTCLRKFEGHSSFIYSLSLRDNTLLSCGEDGTLRVWERKDEDYACVQTVNTPAISVWCCDMSTSGEIIIGTSDNMSYIFTKNLNHVATKEETLEYEKTILENVNLSHQGQEIKESDLSDPDVLNKPGSHSGKVVMVRSDDKVLVHQWSETDQCWNYMGEAISSKKSAAKKHTYEGVDYDNIIKVDVGDGKTFLDMPYNYSDNPYEVAQAFILKHNLSQEYLEEIAQFIISSQEVPTIGEIYEKSCDPYTGEFSYAPSDEKKKRVIPVTNFVYYNAANYDSTKSALSKFNQGISNNKLSLKDLELILDFTEEIKNSKFTDKCYTAINLISETIPLWPPTSTVPLVDIIRLAFSSCPNEIKIQKRLSAVLENVVGILDSLKTDTSQDKRDMCYTIIYRTISNSFNPDVNCDVQINHCRKIISSMSEILPRCSSQNVRGAIVNLFLNYAIFGHKYPNHTPDFLVDLLIEEIRKSFELDLDKASMFRALAAFGTSVYQKRNKMDPDLKNTITQVVEKLETFKYQEQSFQQGLRELKSLLV